MNPDHRRPTMLAKAFAVLLQRRQTITNRWDETRQNKGDVLLAITGEIDRLIGLHMPHGAPITDVTLNYYACHKPGDPSDWPQKLVFQLTYLHLDPNGHREGLTEYQVSVWPAWSGVDIRIGGTNRRGAKEYLHEVLHAALTNEVPAETGIME